MAICIIFAVYLTTEHTIRICLSRISCHILNEIKMIIHLMYTQFDTDNTAKDHSFSSYQATQNQT